jgi:hypothetical protein
MHTVSAGIVGRRIKTSTVFGVPEEIQINCLLF